MNLPLKAKFLKTFTKIQRDELARNFDFAAYENGEDQKMKFKTFDFLALTKLDNFTDFEISQFLLANYFQN